MKDPKKKAQVDVVEALLDSVIRATTQASGREKPKGSLRRHLEDLDEGITFERKRAVITDLYISLVAREVRRVLKRQAKDGDAREARDAIAFMAIEEVSPYVDGDDGCAQTAGVLLAKLLDDEKHKKRWIRAFLEGEIPTL